MLISPIIYVLTMISLAWEAKSVVGQAGRGYLALLFLFQPMIFIYDYADRPNHHSLLLLCFVISLGFMFRLLQPGCQTRVGYAAGLISALAMWISVESMALVLLYASVLSVLWLWRGNDFARKNRHYWLGLFAGVAVAILSECPVNELFNEIYDNLSIVQVAIIGFIKCLVDISSCGDLFKLEALFYYRLINGFLGLSIVMSATYLCFPKFFGGPYVDVTRETGASYLTKLGEVDSLLPPQKDWLFSMIWFLGPGLAALPDAAYLFWQEHREAYQRWLLILIGFTIFIPLTLYQRRWGNYAEVIMIIPLTELLGLVLKRQEALLAKPWRLAARWSTILLFSLGAWIMAPLLENLVHPPDSIPQFDKVSLIPLCQYLQGDAGGHGQLQRILTYFQFSAEILYRTRHEVIATPYHINSAGIGDMRRVMCAADDAEALRIIKARRVDLILLCPKIEEASYYQSPTQGATFQQLLIQGKVPDWLHAITLPPQLASSFQLFAVAH